MVFLKLNFNSKKHWSLVNSILPARKRYKKTWFHYFLEGFKRQFLSQCLENWVIIKVPCNPNPTLLHIRLRLQPLLSMGWLVEISPSTLPEIVKNIWFSTSSQNNQLCFWPELLAPTAIITNAFHAGWVYVGSWLQLWPWFEHTTDWYELVW